MADDRTFAPSEIRPGDVGVKADATGLIDFLSDKSRIDKLLLTAGALLFRGFGVTPGEIDGVLDRIVPNRLAYVHGNSPRTKVGSNLYTSTEYPSEYVISMHNELSYAHRWPSRLAFYCQIAAETGGATPVVDAAVWLESLDPAVREAYAGGVRYTQNLHGGRGLGKSWQDTFETTDRGVVEEFLGGTEATWEWRADGSLRVTQVRPSTVRHPVTDVEVWFNQSDQWHAASLGTETAAMLAAAMPVEDQPQSVTFADGSPIPDSYVLQVRDRGLANAVDVNWEVGDVVLIDNILVAHGRRAFTGARRILVAMS